jgi:hypothetical protein
MKRDLCNMFCYHPVKDERQNEKYKKIRSTAKQLAELFELLCPESDELDKAIVKLEESVMWANSSIARNE